MESISCRTRGEVRVNPVPHFPNFRSEKVNGIVKLVECEPVAPRLAEDASILYNAMRNEPKAVRSHRHNVDAVDLPNLLNNLTE